MDRDQSPRPCLRPTRWLLLLAALKASAHLLTAGRYPLHADELYYVVCGRHPAWSYPDHPPLTPWVAGAVDAAIGPDPFWLRLAPALTGAVIVYLTGWMAWRFGASRRGQLIAAGALLLSPLFLLSNSMLQTVSFDQLAWVLGTVVWIRILAGGNARTYLGVGAAFAFGVLAKLTVLTWGLGVFGGLLLTSARSHLRRPWPWIGAGIALLAAVPVLGWQSGHGWPVIDFMRASRGDDPVTPWGFLGMQAAMSGPLVGTLLLGAGFVGLLRARALRPWRPVGVAVALTWLVYLVTGGKPYYVGPTHPVLIAAGAAVLDGFLARA